MDDPRQGSRTSNWLYAIWMTGFGLAWTIVWAKMALQNHDVHTTTLNKFNHEAYDSIMHPYLMWIFAAIGVCATLTGLCFIRRMIAR